MSNPNAEKEWLRRIGAQAAAPGQKNASPQEAAPQPAEKNAARGNGFKDIAGMNELKAFVTESFINVLKYPQCAKAYGIKPPSMLFYGPAGCGKTFFAEKMAEEVGINFMKVVPDDLASTYIHGTQQKIAELFRKAERRAPMLLFFDEFDAMVPRRTGHVHTQHNDSEVNEFLCMLNNASDRGIYVLAATNHPERIDRAVLRTGRIDEIFYIDMPDKAARKGLFELELSRLPADENIDTDRLAELTDGYNCKDISYIVASAARKVFNMSILKYNGERQEKIFQALIEDVIARKSPSVTSSALRDYERVRREFSPKDEACRRTTIGFV